MVATPLVPRNQVAKPWKWKPSGAAPIAPCHMKTSHLFYTLRMIWNNHLPEAFHVGVVKLYDFGPTYTTEYFGEAIRRLHAELILRSDLPSNLQREYDEMRAHVTRGCLKHIPELLQ
ncbi:hypothetical protein Lumi_106 [Xylophilus phage Lumi]|nr:hypothetical protein Lumi_106 [Xylophilus phage Lumi]